MKRTLDDAIKNPVDKRHFYDSLMKILNDGKNDVVKFDYAKGYFLQKIFPGAFSVTLNGKKDRRNYCFGQESVENQCVYAVTEFARNKEGCITEYKLDKIDTKCEKAWRDYVDLLFDEGKEVELKRAEKRVKALENLYYKTLSDELEKIKIKIFGTK